MASSKLPKRFAVVDFETTEILPRPDYPPRALSVSVWLSNEKAPRFYGWGHQGSPSADWNHAQRLLGDLWGDPLVTLVFHNAKFDLVVAEHSFNLRLRRSAWDRVHDTMFLAFLSDPYSSNLKLKQLAERYLGEPPEERDALADWLRANVPEVRRAPSRWFAHLDKAPHGLVAQYCVGDVRRTAGLFRLLLPQVLRSDMRSANDRERRLLPHLMRMEAHGVPVDVRRLHDDLATYGLELERCDEWVRRRLRAKDLDVNKSRELADAIERRGLVDEWVLTNKGERSTAHDSLKVCVKDKPLIEMLEYRSILATSLRTFMGPWYDQASRTGGRIHTNWNQVRQDRSSSGGNGTKTGRLSSNPNYQNIITNKAVQPKGRLPLPKVRSYIVPPAKKGAIFGRDYSQQEFRALAHYEDGPLLEAYQANPRMDVHETAQVMINAMLSANFKRKPIKNTGFGLVYGMGLGKLAASSNIDVETARRLRSAYLERFPGIKELNRELARLAAAGEPLRTWGGRLYHCEPPQGGRTFEYRMLNTLIQGSSADATKEAMIRYMDGLSDGDEPLYLSVHDELVSGCHDYREAPEWLERLREAMESLEFDVPMLSDGAWSRNNWSELK